MRYTFIPEFPQEGMVVGWSDFANALAEAINAFYASLTFPLTRDGFACNTSGVMTEQRAPFSDPSVQSTLDDIITDTYMLMTKLDNPFTHLAGLLDYLAVKVNEDPLTPAQKALLFTSMLNVQCQLIRRYVSHTGFSPREGS